MIDNLKFATLKQNAIRTLDRFPFLFLLAFCTFVLMVAQQSGFFDLSSHYFNTLNAFICFVGLYAVPLTLAAESLSFSKTKAFLLSLVIGSITWALHSYSFTPFGFDVALAIVSFLLYFVAPFAKDGNNDRLCYYWYRIIQAIYWTVIPCLLLTLAVGCIQFSLKALFSISFSKFISSCLYNGIWILIGSLLFYGQLPTPNDINTVQECSAPKPIKIILTWLLIPFTLVFFFILYAYFIKAAITQENVRGVLVGLIIGYSMFGIGGLLSSYPLISEGNKSASLLHRFFFPIIILPALILLWRVYVRLHIYGLTPDRIYAFVFALWLFGIAVSYSFTRIQKRQLRFVPFSLAVVTLLMYAGPWDPVSLSNHSQTNRVITALKAENVYKDGHVIVQEPKPHIQSQANQDKIVSGFDYLNGAYGRRSNWGSLKNRNSKPPLAILFKGTSLEKNYGDYYSNSNVSATFGYRLLARFAVPLNSADRKIEPVQNGTVINPNLYLSFKKSGASDQTAYAINGYDVFVPVFSIAADGLSKPLYFNEVSSTNDPFQAAAPTALMLQGSLDNAGSPALLLTVRNKTGATIDTLRIELEGPLKPYITQERMAHETDGLLLEARGNVYTAKLKLTQWSGKATYTTENKEKTINNLTSRSLTATIFLRKR